MAPLAAGDLGVRVLNPAPVVKTAAVTFDQTQPWQFDVNCSGSGANNIGVLLQVIDLIQRNPTANAANIVGATNTTTKLSDLIAL